MVPVKHRIHLCGAELFASTAASLAHFTSTNRFSTLTSHEHFLVLLEWSPYNRAPLWPLSALPHLLSSHKNHSLLCEHSATFPAPRSKSSTFLSAHRARWKGHTVSYSAATLLLGPRLPSVALIKHPTKGTSGGHALFGLESHTVCHCRKSQKLTFEKARHATPAVKTGKKGKHAGLLAYFLAWSQTASFSCTVQPRSHAVPPTDMFTSQRGSLFGLFKVVSCWRLKLAITLTHVGMVNFTFQFGEI